MPSDKLTELGIKMSKSGKKEQKLYDGQGLYLLIHPNGSKYWRVKYRLIQKVFGMKANSKMDYRMGRDLLLSPQEVVLKVNLKMVGHTGKGS